MDQSHPDPFQEAMHNGLQRALQIAASAATAAQVYVYQQRSQASAIRDGDARSRRVYSAQTRAERDAARTVWSPALDPRWLQQADLIDTARAWGAAMPYADRDVPWYEPSAATAMRKCEERLSEHHPYAMARYDRLRADGLRPAEAMAEAAPLFARPPRARDASMAPRPALVAGDGTGIAWVADAPVPPPPQPGADAGALGRRGSEILAALQARAREHGRDPLGADEQRIVLETVTDLPAEVIDKLVGPASASTASTPAGVATARAARPWQNDFPVPIQDVVAGAAGRTPVTAPSAAPSRTARQAGRHIRRRT